MYFFKTGGIVSNDFKALKLSEKVRFYLTVILF